MIHELNHRVKNTLATVQAIASETLLGADPAIRAALDGRLMALSAVHDALTRQSWQRVALRDVVGGALAPFGGADTARFQVSGPPVLLLPRAAVALAMGLHELATNATRYGALLLDTGRIGLVWAIHDDDAANFHLQWTEQGGPPVTPPAQRGFGTNMIAGALAGDLGGSVDIHFNRDGVRCVIEAPLDEVAAPEAAMALPLVGRF
jgi:two-component sensor histidine kinase